MTAVLYRCFDSIGALLYVGSTKALPTRVGAHMSTKPWAAEIATIKVEHFDTMALAASAEGRAIYFERPKYNKVCTTGQRLSSGAQVGRPPDRDKDKTLTAVAPWKAEGLSRATWYRRKRTPKG